MKIKCKKELPEAPKKGKSKFFQTMYSDDQCKTIKTEKAHFSWVDNDYEDGTCVKFQGDSEDEEEETYAKYYCQDGLTYILGYTDKSCKNYAMAFIMEKTSCVEDEKDEYKRVTCEFYEK